MNCGPDCRCSNKNYRLAPDLGEITDQEFIDGLAGIPPVIKAHPEMPTIQPGPDETVVERVAEYMEEMSQPKFRHVDDDDGGTYDKPQPDKGSPSAESLSLAMLSGIYDPTSPATYQTMKAARKEAQREEQAARSRAAWAKLTEAVMSDPTAKAAYEQVRAQLERFNQDQDGEGM